MASSAKQMKRADEAPAFPDMDPAVARQLFESGAFFLFLDFQEGSEFGIDYHSWTVGHKFKGLKMIPPGVHFIYFSCFGKRGGGRAPRIGFFHNFHEKELLVKRWDSTMEDIATSVVSDEEIERYRGNLKELDGFLGPYPYQSLKTWFSLSNHISPELVKQLEPKSGRITTQCELTTLESEALGGARSRVDREHPNRLRFVDDQGLPIMNVKEGHQLMFHPFPQHKVPHGCVGSEVTHHSMDSSHQLGEFISAHFQKDVDVLGEMQFAFLCFLLGHVYEGFEQWKRLVRLLCSCTAALNEREELYSQFVMGIFFQLKECPRDFFVDIVTKDNFLTTTLSNLFLNMDSNPKVSSQLKEKTKKFKTYLTKRFKWTFEVESDRPTIVEVEEPRINL